MARLLSISTLTMQFREFRISSDSQCQCATKEVSDVVMSDVISVEELHAKLQNKENVTLLDVRSMEERAVHHIGGMCIPLGELPSRLAELISQDEIVIYCHLGQRSLYAVQLLKKAKFRSVRSLEGGLKAWQRQFC
jgi:adenylyltransferase/sulfurtransferase